jgi:hypothetical protein
MLWLFAPLMFVGAFAAWAWIPDVQTDRREKNELPPNATLWERLKLPNRELEKISEMPVRDNLSFGVVENFRSLLHLPKKPENTQSSPA